MTIRVVPSLLILSASLFAQTVDTGTAHKAAATALLNANNIGAAHLACPDFAAPPGSAAAGRGPARGAGGRGPAATPARESWYAEGGQVFDNLYMLTTKA